MEMSGELQGYNAEIWHILFDIAVTRRRKLRIHPPDEDRYLTCFGGKTRLFA